MSHNFTLNNFNYGVTILRLKSATFLYHVTGWILYEDTLCLVREDKIKWAKIRWNFKKKLSEYKIFMMKIKKKICVKIDEIFHLKSEEFNFNLTYYEWKYIHIYIFFKNSSKITFYNLFHFIILHFPNHACFKIFKKIIFLIIINELINKYYFKIYLHNLKYKKLFF